MTPHYPAATAVERTQARVERSYLRADGTPEADAANLRS
jgi:hypothetical protein